MRRSGSHSPKRLGWVTSQHPVSTFEGRVSARVRRPALDEWYLCQGQEIRPGARHEPIREMLKGCSHDAAEGPVSQFVCV